MIGDPPGDEFGRGNVEGGIASRGALGRYSKPYDLARVVKATVFLAEDLTRRDFTVNAFAYDPFAERLVEVPEGLVDLAAGRAVRWEPGTGWTDPSE